MMSASFSVVLTPVAAMLEAVPGTENTYLRGHEDARASLRSLCSLPCAVHRCPRNHQKELVSNDMHPELP